MKKLTSLDEIRKVTDGDNALLKEITKSFIVQLPELIKQLNNAYCENRMMDVKNIAHKMKSSLTYFGMHDQKLKAQNIENFAETNFEKAGQLISEITTEAELAVEELKLAVKEIN